MRHFIYAANFLPQRVSRTLGIFDLFLCVISNPRQALQEYSNITLFARIARVLCRQDEPGEKGLPTRLMQNYSNISLFARIALVLSRQDVPGKKGLDYSYIIHYSRDSHLFLCRQDEPGDKGLHNYNIKLITRIALVLCRQH